MTFQPEDAVSAVEALVSAGSPFPAAVVAVVDVLSPEEQAAVIDYMASH